MTRPFTIYSFQPCRKILLLLVYIMGWLNVHGQSFPVETALSITPPHSLLIEELGSAFNSNLQGTLLLKDLNTSSLDVVLRLTIESNSLKIQTNPMYTGTIITLDPGIPHTLNNQELSDLFRMENLTFSGLSKANYQKTGRLPEGEYKICLRTYEVSRNIPVSNIACNYIRLVLHDPPFINLPENNTKIESRLPQNIFFQWSPRHQDPSFQTEYEFTLAEIFPQDRNAYDAFATSPIVFQTITPLTSLTYTNDYPLLEPGKRYAFRIRVLNSMNSLFKNDGYSEVFTFLYGDACKMPETMHIEDIREDYIQWSMEESGDYNSYQISYISKENLSKQPYNKDFYTSRMHLTALKPSTTYAIEIRGNCRGYYSPPLLAEIKTTAPYFNPFTCSDQTPPLPDPGGSPEYLLKGDTLFSSDFKVIVEEAQASNGSFSGTGYIQIPFFQRALVGVQFEDITLNSHYRHLSGIIRITGAGIDMSEIIHYLDSLDNLLDRGEEMLTEIQTIVDTLTVYLPGDNKETMVQEETDTLTTITLTNTESTEEATLLNNQETTSTIEGQNNLNQIEIQSSGTATVLGTSTTNSSATETHPEPSTSMKFGPLDIQFKDIPQPGGTDESGYCTYTDLSGSTLFKLPFDFVDKEIHL
ncbi:MAG: fibronectin type III domain-containing protein, partial [Cyclobacteriaceae bacterium]|nr:fibronectin type III domain-containing protein [Cyclobacteriaceae bacterium]